MKFLLYPLLALYFVVCAVGMGFSWCAKAWQEMSA